MKKILAWMLITFSLVALVGCGSVDDVLNQLGVDAVSDLVGNLTGDAGGDMKTYEGDMGDRMKTYFFDFTVDSAELLDSYAGYTPEEGQRLLDVVITTKNTFGEEIVMLEYDYQLQWGERGDNDDYAFALEALDDSCAPLTHDLPDGESMTYHYLFEVPQEASGFELAYLEIFVDENDEESYGDLYFVSLNA